MIYLICSVFQMIMKAGHGGSSGRFQRMKEMAEACILIIIVAQRYSFFFRYLPLLYGLYSGVVALLLE